MIFLSRNTAISHFGILFENRTFELKHNGEVISPKGSKPFLFVENVNGGFGVTFFLTDEEGKQKRLQGKIRGLFGELSQATDPVQSNITYDTLSSICHQEN